MTWFDSALVFASFAGLGVGLLALLVGAMRSPVPAPMGPDDDGGLKPRAASPAAPPSGPPEASAEPPKGETPPDPS